MTENSNGDFKIRATDEFHADFKWVNLANLNG